MSCQHSQSEQEISRILAKSACTSKKNFDISRYSSWKHSSDNETHSQPPPLSPLKPSAMAYCITIPGLPGKVSPELCLDAGVPAGPLMQELRENREVLEYKAITTTHGKIFPRHSMKVVLDDGRTVTPSEVMEERTPQLSCLVVDCPNEHFLQSLAENDRIASMGRSTEMPFVFHFTPREVRRSIA